MPSEQSIVDAYTRRALLLIRVASDLGAQALDALRKLARELRGLIAGEDLSAMGRRDMAALLREIDDAITARFDAIEQAQADALADLLDAEAAWAANAGGFKEKPSATAIASALSGLLVLGWPLLKLWNRQGANLSDRIAATLRGASANGQPLVDAVVAIFGQGPRGRERGGLFETARQQAATLADTSAHAAAYAGRLAAWKAAGVSMLKWHSILDSRTTIHCAVRAGKTYSIDFKPIGHDIPMGPPPPAHWNCRSILIAMSPDYTPPSDGQDPYSESLDAWLNRQPERLQDELLGPTRAGLWRAGKITTRGLVGRDGEPLPIEKL